MIGGLLLALVSAAFINIGFLLQHRGLHHHPDGGLVTRLRAAIHEPVWLAGQVIGWAGFLAQIVAVAIAPLSLVQAFAAGGLALSVPIAAGLFHHRVSRAQVLAVLAIAAGLAALPIGVAHTRDHLDGDALTLALAAGAAAAFAVWVVRTGWARAIAAGLFYGLADAAIKALSLHWHHHGLHALLSSWTLIAAGGTFLGFLAFQSALEHDDAVAAISLMTALTALVALGCGLLAFAETLGRGAGPVGVHLVAIAIVLGCVPILAAAQAAIVEASEDGSDRTAPADPAVASVPGPR